MHEAFFRREGPLLVATELTRGPWSDALMHGGPPTALLGSAIARAGPEPERFQVARLTFELVRPLAIGALRVETEVLRAGKQVQRLAARLLQADGTELARAQGVRIRRAAVALPPDPRPAPALPAREGVAPFAFPFFDPAQVAYHRGVEVRIVRGEWGPGPLVAWMRPVVPLVAGEASTPLERLLILVDAESGVCPPVDPRVWQFPNPDLTVYLERDPAGEWFALEAGSRAGPEGIGLVWSALHDDRGPLGRAAQSLVVDRR